MEQSKLLRGRMCHSSPSRDSLLGRTFFFFFSSRAPSYLPSSPSPSSSLFSTTTTTTTTTCNRDIPENQFALAGSFAFSVASRGRRSPRFPLPSLPPRCFFLRAPFLPPPSRNVALLKPPSLPRLAREGAYVLLLPFP